MSPVLAKTLLHLTTISCLAAAGLVAASLAGWMPTRSARGTEETKTALNGHGSSNESGLHSSESDETDPTSSFAPGQDTPIQPGGRGWTTRRLQGPLFDPPPAVQPPPPAPMPPPLVLRGTVAEGEQSRAFVAGRDGTAHVLRLGDQLDGAELALVGTDHAVFLFQGVEHKLGLTP